MNYSIVFAQTTIPNAWAIFLRDDQGALHIPDYNLLPFEHIPMATGIYDYICEYHKYTDSQGFVHKNLIRVLFFVSPCYVNVNGISECGTLYTSPEYQNVTTLLSATLDNLNEYSQYRNYAINTAMVSMPYILATFGDAGIALQNVINHINNPAAIHASMPINPSVSNLPIAVTNDVKTETKFDTKHEPEPASSQPKIDENSIKVKRELEELRAAFEQLQQQVKDTPPPPPPQVIEIIHKPEPDESLAKLQSEVQTLRSQLETVQTQVVKHEIQPARQIIPTIAKPEPNNKSINAHTKEIAKTESKTKAMITWLYSNSITATNSFKDKALQTLAIIGEKTSYPAFITTSVVSLNWTVAAIAEHNVWIDRQQLWDDHRSRLTPGAISTTLAMAASTCMYLYTLKIVTQPKQEAPHPLAAAALRTVQKYSKRRNKA